MSAKLKVYQNKKTGQLTVVLPKKLFLNKKKVCPKYLKVTKDNLKW